MPNFNLLHNRFFGPEVTVPQAQDTQQNQEAPPLPKDQVIRFEPALELVTENTPPAFLHLRSKKKNGAEVVARVKPAHLNKGEGSISNPLAVGRLSLQEKDSLTDYLSLDRIQFPIEKFSTVTLSPDLSGEGDLHFTPNLPTELTHVSPEKTAKFKIQLSFSETGIQCQVQGAQNIFVEYKPYQDKYLQGTGNTHRGAITIYAYIPGKGPWSLEIAVGTGQGKAYIIPREKNYNPNQELLALYNELDANKHNIVNERDAREAAEQKKAEAELEALRKKQELKEKQKEALKLEFRKIMNITKEAFTKICDEIAETKDEAVESMYSQYLQEQGSFFFFSRQYWDKIQPAIEQIRTYIQEVQRTTQKQIPLDLLTEMAEEVLGPINKVAVAKFEEGPNLILNNTNPEKFPVGAKRYQLRKEFFDLISNAAYSGFTREQPKTNWDVFGFGYFYPGTLVSLIYPPKRENDSVIRHVQDVLVKPGRTLYFSNTAIKFDTREMGLYTPETPTDIPERYAFSFTRDQEGNWQVQQDFSKEPGHITFVPEVAGQSFSLTIDQPGRTKLGEVEFDAIIRISIKGDPTGRIHFEKHIGIKQ